MPLHDVSYQRFEGRRTGRLSRSLALARSASALLLKRRGFILLLAICWIPAVVRAVQIYVARQFPQAVPFVSVDAALFQSFLSGQVVYLPVVVVALYAGAGAVADDRRSGALVAYLSKPIRHADYLLGKALPILAAILAVTLVPGLALLVVDASIARGFGVLSIAPALPLSVVAYSLWIGLYFTAAVVAMSSLAGSARVAGAGFVALVLGSKILVSGALARLHLTTPPIFLSLIDAASESSYLFFGRTGSARAPYLAAFAMAVLIGVFAVIVFRRLRSAGVSA